MPLDPTNVRDVVIVVPGIMGTELLDATDRPLWSVRAGGLTRAIRTLGGSLAQLELPKGIGDGPAPDGVRPGRLIDSLHVVPGIWSPVTGYDGLFDFLKSDRFHLVDGVKGDPDVMPNLLAFPYDWRLSNRYNGRLLAKAAIEALDRWREQPGMEEAKLILVCHSMGGLIARWFAEKEGGADRIRALITIGTPFRGAVKALDTLANGLEPGIGPLRLPLTDFARSLPSMYQLLPEYACLVTSEGRKTLRDVPCPQLDDVMLRDAFAFQDAIRSTSAPAYQHIKVIGIRQPTLTTARVTSDGVLPYEAIDGKNQGGDGTVPRLAAEFEIGRGVEAHEVANQHGELQATRSLHDLVDGILAREEIIWQDTPSDAFGVEMADIWAVEDVPRLRVTDMNNRRLQVTLLDETNRTVGEPILVSPDGAATLGPLPDGGYRAVVSARQPGGQAVTKPFVVIDPAIEIER